MQKLKFILDFTFAIIVACLHSKMPANLQTHKKQVYTRICSIQNISGSVDRKVRAHDAHIQQHYIDIYHMSYLRHESQRKKGQFLLSICLTVELFR